MKEFAYQIAWYHNPEYYNLSTHCHENTETLEGNAIMCLHIVHCSAVAFCNNSGQVITISADGSVFSDIKTNVGRRVQS